MNTHVAPYFKEDFYKGQDVVHYGIRVPLQGDLETVVSKFSRNAKKIIKNYRDYMFDCVSVSDLQKLRNFWFDPNDETFPETLQGHVGWTMWDSTGELLGGIILTPSGKGLFLHQLIASEQGKKEGAPTLLIYHAVKELMNDQWHSLDVGVSYNPKRYRFFENFAVQKYPVILKKPFYTPTIRLSPFRQLHDYTTKQISEKSDTTFVPRGVYGIYALLKHLNLRPDDTVSIVKTFGSTYVAKCVTDTIEKVCKWRLDIVTSETKAVLVIHEFGIPCRKLDKHNFKEELKQRNIPIIEDCAWRYKKVLDYSDYQIFSYQKMLNVNYGGMIAGVSLSDDFLWTIGCFDFVKKQQAEARHLKESLQMGAGELERALFWTRYYQLVKDNGMEMDDCFDYLGAVANGEWNPTVFLQKVDSEKTAVEIVDRLRDFGVQAGVYWGEGVFYVPIHQNMTDAEVDYIFAVVAGYFNLCANYQGK